MKFLILHWIFSFHQKIGTAVSLLLSLSAFCSPKESRAALAASA